MDGNTLVAITAAELARWGAFRLGATRIDPASREVAGPGGAATIEPRVMQVLLVLAHAAGGVVTRDDLSRLCWNSQIVGDDALNRAVGEVRRLARTVAGGEFGVETIPRTGYRLTGAVIASDDRDPTEPAREPGPGPSPPRLSRRWAIGGGAVALAGAAAGAWKLWPDGAGGRAADLAAQARMAMNDGLPESAAQAVNLFQEATALRPRDAAMWGGLALAWEAMAEFSAPAQMATAVKACELAAARALALDPAQADARTALIVLRSTYGDWLVVERGLRGVLARTPSAETASAELATLLQSVGRSRECADMVDRLVVRQPLSPVYAYRHVYMLWTRGRMGDADRAADRAFGLWPRHPAVWFARLWLMGFTGRTGVALAQIDDADARPAGLSQASVGLLRTSMRAIGSREPAMVRAATEGNLAAATVSPSRTINAIMILSALGRLDEAFMVVDGYMLRRGASVTPARASGSQAVVADTSHRHSQLLFVPVTAPLRADPRFLPMCEACGLADYWRQSGHPPDFLAGKPA